MKKALALLLAALLLLSSAALAEEEGITLRFIRVGNDTAETNFWATVIEDYEAANPGITIEYISGQDQDAMLNTMFAANLAPDVIGVGIASLPQLASMGQYIPLDDYFAEWDEGSDMVERVLQNGYYDGTLYALGYSVTPYVFAYRIDLLEEAGLEVPTTWEELKEAALALTVRDENGVVTRAGFAFPMSGGNMVEYDVFVFGNGGRFTDEDMNPTIDTEEGLEAFEFLNSFLAEVNIPYSNNDINPFLTGNAAMTLINNVSLRPILENEEYIGKVGIAFPPTNGTHLTFSGCNMLSISCDSEHPDEAFEFIKFALSTEIVLRRAEMLNVPVVRTSLLEEYNAMDPYNAVRSDCVQNGISMPATVWSPQFMTIRNELIQKVLFGESDPATALSEAQEKLEEEIEFL